MRLAARSAAALALAALSLAGLAADAALSSSGGGTLAPFGPAGERLPVGCTAGGPPLVSGGPGGRRSVGLTFDDGPSARYTPKVLAILGRFHARATFFEEGRHVAGNEALMVDQLADGDEIGNHSFHHPLFPGFAELDSTNLAIEDATGFTPCLFRPPYGLADTRVLSAARRARLKPVLWSVDSDDAKHPGAATIRSNVLRMARPGSIVLMHDGGRHPQTVIALPGILRGLRARGLRTVTVSELLGGRLLYR